MPKRLTTLVMFTLFLFAVPSCDNARPARYALLQGTIFQKRPGQDRQIPAVFKIDTETGQTWMYEDVSLGAPLADFKSFVSIKSD
jgi:hypothetical protein